MKKVILISNVIIISVFSLLGDLCLSIAQSRAIDCQNIELPYPTAFLIDHSSWFFLITVVWSVVSKIILDQIKTMPKDRSNEVCITYTVATITIGMMFLYICSFFSATGFLYYFNSVQ